MFIHERKELEISERLKSIETFCLCFWVLFYCSVFDPLTLMRWNKDSFIYFQVASLYRRLKMCLEFLHFHSRYYLSITHLLVCICFVLFCFMRAHLWWTTAATYKSKRGRERITDHYSHYVRTVSVFLQGIHSFWGHLVAE